MPSTPRTLDLASFIVDRSLDEPLHLQIYHGVRDSILNGRLAPGLRLPSTRTMALSWAISRSTVLAAIDQLKAEGYLEGRAGSGVFVSHTIPDRLNCVKSDRAKSDAVPTGGNPSPQLSNRGSSICDEFRIRREYFDHATPFRPGVPAEGTFPSKRWSRLSTRLWRKFECDPPLVVEPMGYSPLREAIAVHLGATRGVSCDADQIVIVSSTQHALMMLGQILLDSGDSVWIEDPGYLRAQAALAAVGAKVEPIPLDDEGIDLEHALRTAPSAKLCYVTPSHQYPLGITMSLSRRLALLEWSARSRSWIVEDDYMAEYRYAGQPLVSLQGLDEFARVIYLGTFSKTFSPALRLGFIVIPQELISAFNAVRSLIDRCPSFIDQAVLAEFMREGHLGRHVRRMRRVYDERRNCLRHALNSEIPCLDLRPVQSGMHTVAWLPSGSDDCRVARHLAEEGVVTFPLSTMCHRPIAPALILGYAGWNRVQTLQQVRRMERSLRTILSEYCS